MRDAGLPARPDGCGVSPGRRPSRRAGDRIEHALTALDATGLPIPFDLLATSLDAAHHRLEMQNRRPRLQIAGALHVITRVRAVRLPDQAAVVTKQAQLPVGKPGHRMDVLAWIQAGDPFPWEPVVRGPRIGQQRRQQGIERRFHALVVVERQDPVAGRMGEREHARGRQLAGVLEPVDDIGLCRRDLE